MPEIVDRQSAANEHRGRRALVFDPLRAEGNAERDRRLFESSRELPISIGQRVGQAGDVILAGDLCQAPGQRRRRAFVPPAMSVSMPIERGLASATAPISAAILSRPHGHWPLAASDRWSISTMTISGLGGRRRDASNRSKLRSRRCSANSERPASSMRTPIRIASQTEDQAVAQRLSSSCAGEKFAEISRRGTWVRRARSGCGLDHCWLTWPANHNGILVMITNRRSPPAAQAGASLYARKASRSSMTISAPSIRSNPISRNRPSWRLTFSRESPR